MNDKPRVSRFRLSLRALMVIVLVSGGLIGWKANRAHTQRRAVEAIKAINGNVVYDFQYAGNDVLTPAPFSARKEPDAPKWLRNLLGDEYFQEVTMVDIRSPVSADLLPTIAKLDHLVHLGLNGSKLDDSAMAQIAKIPSLLSLVLSQGSVTDAGLANLAGARKLRRLALHGASGVTDAGMTSLADLPDLKSVEIFVAPKLTALGLKNLGPRLADLERLILYMTAITDDGMACMEDCRKMKTLSLSSAKIGDAGFAHFRKMDSLTQLVVSSTAVTDEGLERLAGLKNLESLSLGNTKVTDEGLNQIRKLKGLKFLMIQGTQISPQAVAALQAERPTLRIGFGPAAPVRVAPVATASPAKK
jgi:Leucine Rich repeat